MYHNDMTERTARNSRMNNSLFPFFNFISEIVQVNKISLLFKWIGILYMSCYSLAKIFPQTSGLISILMQNDVNLDVSEDK